MKARAHYLLREEEDDQVAWELAAGSGGSFDPRQVSAIKRWYRLAASTPVSGEYQTIVDVFGGTALTQTSSNRKPAASTAANGLPIAMWDGSDMALMTLDASGTGNNSDTTWEIDVWWNIVNIAGAAQRILACDTAAGASLNRLRIGTLAAGSLSVDVFVTNADGRNFTTAITNGIHHLRIAYNSAGTQDSTASPAATDKMRVWIDGVASGLTAVNIGAGGALGSLRSATGTAIFGAANDADAPVSPQLNTAWQGPNLTIADAILSDTEAANLRLFEVPT